MNATDQPAWIREIITLLPAASHYLLTGNVHDSFYLSLSDHEQATRSLRPAMAIVGDVLSSQGINTGIEFHIARGATVYEDSDPETIRLLEEEIGAGIAEACPADSLSGLADLVQAIGQCERPAFLFVRAASRLVPDPTRLEPEEFSFFRVLEHHARTATTRRNPATGRRQFNPILWILDSERDFPGWFRVGNEFVRSVVLASPNVDDRLELSLRLVTALSHTQPTDADSESVEAASQRFAAAMAGASLVEMERAMRIARDQQLSLDRVEDAAKSYRLGVVDNPWRSPYLLGRLRAETDANSSGSASNTILTRRVLGQDRAVARSLDILVRSATGLTAAQSGPSGSRPRGVLFFAGPTGVGKTELAKSLTRLLFDDESFYVRFDMSEFSSEHSEARLIGAPPGYVGYDAGGHLTNAVRSKPFSLVLFDEIEKAHPRILDKFLQILDDGRLTDGQGDTVFFTESIIVFTSNLGIYESVEERTDAGAVRVQRRLAVDPDSMTSSEIEAKVRSAIEDYFTLELGRPELLNRIGDNIVVFDFISAEVAVRILEQMVNNVAARVEKEYTVDVRFSTTSLDVLAAACLTPEVLALGGRGIGARLETALVNPLARELFTRPPSRGEQAVIDVRRGAEEGPCMITMSSE